MSSRTFPEQGMGPKRMNVSTTCWWAIAGGAEFLPSCVRCVDTEIDASKSKRRSTARFSSLQQTWSDIVSAIYCSLLALLFPRTSKNLEASLAFEERAGAKQCPAMLCCSTATRSFGARNEVRLRRDHRPSQDIQRLVRRADNVTIRLSFVRWPFLLR